MAWAQAMVEAASLEAPYNVLTENSEQVLCPDDAASITTEGSNWCLVEAEEGEVTAEEYVIHSDAENDDEWSEAASNAGVMPDVSIEKASLSASLLWANPFELGHPLLAQCEEHVGDITDSWAKALQGFPTVPSIFCLGRLAVSLAAEDAETPSTISVVARAAVFNNGTCTWPDSAALRIVAGDSFGLHSLPCGGLPPGCGAELVLDLAVPATAADRGMGGRSAWVLIDGDGEPFGPVLVVEVIWT